MDDFHQNFDQGARIVQESLLYRLVYLVRSKMDFYVLVNFCHLCGPETPFAKTQPHSACYICFLPREKARKSVGFVGNGRVLTEIPLAEAHFGLVLQASRAAADYFSQTGRKVPKPTLR
jgi:hypothetical protein